jgi:heat shock protein HslJ
MDDLEIAEDQLIVVFLTHSGELSFFMVPLIQHTPVFHMFNKPAFQSGLMDTRSALIALLVIIYVLTSGCTTLSSVISPRQNELKGPTWRLVSYSAGERTQIPVGPQTNITLKFDEQGNASGFLDSCRSYSGRYTTLGETIRVTNLTEVNEDRCPWTPQTVEMKNTYFSLLQKSSRFTINEDTLILGYYDAERYLEYSRI